MKEIVVAFWSLYEELCSDDRIFHVPDAPLSENLFVKWNRLRSEGEKRRIRFVMLNRVKSTDQIDCMLFADFPRTQNPLVAEALQSSAPKLLLIEECEVIRPQNWRPENHRLFDAVFTWNDAFVDNRFFFKVNFYFLETRRISPNLALKDKLCVMIASNKRAAHRLELYSERRRAIRWFEKHHPDDFDLFGQGWDRFFFPSDVFLLNRLNGPRALPLRSLVPARKYPLWRGAVDRKKPIFEKYKFALAYDNAKDIPGYILEKIWDPIFAGTVPVYRGAPNVQDHISKGCYVDLRDFRSYEELYTYLAGMPEKEYVDYLDRINAFLAGPAADQFSEDHFSKVVLDRIEAVVASRDGRVRPAAAG